MHLSRKLSALAMSGVVLLGMVGAASAAQAVATGSVNVRSGPSTQYGRVDTLQRNQLVEVTSCRGSWCYVEKPGADGWVSANYLAQVRTQQSVKPSIIFSFNFGKAPVVRRPHQEHDNGYWNHRNDRDYRDDRWNGGHRRQSNGLSFSFGN